jgi:hypothetical protein
VASKLGGWLGTLSSDQLASILIRRPDSLAPPTPRSLGELADRLQSRPSVTAALHCLPLPAVQVVEAIQALGGPTVPRQLLAEAVGRTVDDPDLDATLQVLAQRALVWPDGDQLRMASPLWSAFAYPLQIGPPAERLFAARNAPELRKIAQALGLAGGRTKQQVIEDLVDALGAGAVVRAAVAEAPAEVRETLEQAAWHNPVVRHPEIIYGYGHSPNPTLDWALSRGLLVADGWQAAVMPGEVSMALRGPQWRVPFDPQPPVPALTEVDRAAVAREAAAAGSGAVAAVTELLEVCASTPPTILKAGGIGARELRRLGKAIGADETAARLWLELAAAAGLVAAAEQTLLPTPAYDTWRGGEPAARLVPLLRAWWRLPAAPLAVRPASGETPPAALVRTPGFGELIQDVRQELIRAADALPEGHGLVDETALAEVLGWRVPLLAGELLDFADLPPAIWSEAALLGVIAHGALTPLGQALVHDQSRLPGIATGLLPEAVETVLFQADLTAVVPGTPAAALATLLDSAAGRESSGGAVIWRFSPSSVRRALDQGVSAAKLLADLATVAAGGVLPQPLEYLVGDVARQHGRIRVRAMACALRADDPALLEEIAATRSLASLRLALLAPTVLASAKPVEETLAALRSAGYAPVGEKPDGSLMVERVELKRAPVPRPRRTAPRRSTVDSPEAGAVAGSVGTGAAADSPLGDAAALATALLAAPRGHEGGRSGDEPAGARTARAAHAGVARPVAAEGPEALIEMYATQLSAGERRLLAHAVEESGPVKIRYTNAQGNPSARVIEPLAVHGRVVEAWCHLREEERMFALDRIDSVAPA